MQAKQRALYHPNAMGEPRCVSPEPPGASPRSRPSATGNKRQVELSFPPRRTTPNHTSTTHPPGPRVLHCQFPPPHLYSQSKARWHTFRDLLLREPCTLEAMSPGDLRPHSRSPAPCTATSPPAKPVTLHFHPAAVWHTAGPQVRVGRKKDVAAAESRVEAGHLC